MNAWTEIAPGRWQRPIGENETFIKMIGDGGRQFAKDVWSISVTANFRFHAESGIMRQKNLTDDLRDGWKILRFHHPSIASLAHEDTLEYSTPDAQELEKWAAESFILIEDDSSPEDVIANVIPHRFATLYYLCKLDVVVLNISHWRTDGIGAFHILNEYFRAVIQSLHKNPIDMAWGKEANRLVPAVEDALNLLTEATPEINRAAQSYLETIKHHIGAVRTTYKDGQNIIPQGTRSIQYRFSKNETTRLEDECRRINVRLAAAVHASVASTAFSIANSETNQRHHSSTLRVSLRPHLPAPYDGIAGAAGLYTAGYVVKVPSYQSWLDNAKQYEIEYSKGATPELLCSRRQYAVVMKSILKNAPIPNPPPSGLDISWVPEAEKIVEPIHKSAAESIEVSDIGIGVDVASRHLYVFTWTFNGQLGINLVYNEAFYEKHQVEKVLDTVKLNLVSKLIPTNG